ncbi:MAG: ATP-binding protein [Steroidobacteraceae bacterium]
MVSGVTDRRERFGVRRLLQAARSLWAELTTVRRTRESVRGKLMWVVSLTTVSALLVAASALLWHDLTVYRHSWVSDLKTEAGILSIALTPALEFDDQGGAERNLVALQARPQLLAAALYLPNGDLYADFVRLGSVPPPLRLASSSAAVHISGQRVELIQRIVRNGEPLGTIYLRARYDVLGRVITYLGILAVVIGISLLAGLVLSTVLQRIITAPLDAMSEVARQIVHQRDYSLRVQKTTDDEIGLVVDAFNSMLQEVQSRTRALEHSNVALQAEVQVRQVAEQALTKSERLYRAIGESIDYGVWVCDADGRNTYASEPFRRLLGLSQEQCFDPGWNSLLHPAEAAATAAAWRECVRSGSNWYREHRLLGSDGHYHAVLAKGVPIRDDHGRIAGWAGINLDIARLKETESALREADRRKDEFLATLAHELRNPLAPIRNAARLLELPVADDQQRQWGRDVIARQVQRMALLLDDLLDVSRITRGRLQLRRQPVELDALVASAIETARPLIDAKLQLMHTQLPEQSVMLDVDPLRLSQALSNLLTNAAKYTDPAGTITLRALVNASELSLSVSDTGIGLAPDAIPKLFEMFSQLDSSVDRAEGGLGIGLALVKGLVALHGGTVEASSAGPGRGSTFTIHLPSAGVLSARTSPTDEVATQRTLPGSPCKVLVADDNGDAAQSLAMVLQMSGYHVHLAGCGRDALALAKRERPDAMFLDIGMPDMSGHEVADQVRREPWAEHTLLVAVTGWGQPDDKQRALLAGFNHHLTKPVDLDHVEQLLAQHAQRLAGRQPIASGNGSAG